MTGFHTARASWVGTLLVVAMMATVGGAAQAEANPAGASAALVEFLVSSGENDFVADRLELKTIDRDPVPELIELMNDATQPRVVRERAVLCLSLYPDARVKEALSAQLRPSGRATTSRELGLTAVAYMEAFGEDVIVDVAPLLYHKSPEVRGYVAQALGLFGGVKGNAMLSERSLSETHPQVLETMHHYILMTAPASS